MELRYEKVDKIPGWGGSVSAEGVFDESIRQIRLLSPGTCVKIEVPEGRKAKPLSNYLIYRSKKLGYKNIKFPCRQGVLYALVTE